MSALRAAAHEPRPYPLRPLLDKAQVSIVSAARTVGVDANQMHRWKTYGLTAGQADEVALAFGFHPTEVWADYCDEETPVIAPDDLPVPAPAGSSFTCPDCAKGFDARQKMSTHRAAVHGWRTDARRPAKQKPKPPAVHLGATFDLPIARLIGRDGEWVEIGTVELRAVATDDGRLRVAARWVTDGDAS